ncbi:hypothetical protein NIES2107_73040 (plasmid) [Nostoc carneum NIES-2107]|nr:hypothetical protein NIES2107_73040 [Nostoc carneum NIES-2107]
MERLAKVSETPDINIFAVDDYAPALCEFTKTVEKLTWLQKITEIGIPNLRTAWRQSQNLSSSRNTKQWQSYIRQTGLSEPDLKELIRLEPSQLCMLSALPLEQLNIQLQTFCMDSDQVYKEVLQIIADAADYHCHFLLLDVYWGNYGNYAVSDPNLLTTSYIRSLWNNPSCSQDSLGAGNLAHKFLEKGEHFFVLRATSARGIDYLLTSPDLSEKAKKNYIPGINSIALGGAPAKVVEMLCVWYENVYASPIGKLRCKGEVGNPASWFSPHSYEVPHEFPTPDSTKFQTAAHCLADFVNLPQHYYNFLSHQGFKSLALTGNTIGSHTLYAIALLADAQRSQSALELSAGFPSYTPIPKHAHLVKTDTCDFAEQIFQFFQGLLEESSIHLSFQNSSLFLESSVPVATEVYNLNGKTLLDRVGSHLHYFKHTQQWSNAHTVSLPLAQCIHYGGWGLVDPQQYILHPQTGPFLVTMQGRKIIFSWQED